MSVDLERPAWHALAACRGDRRWLVVERSPIRVGEMRAVCRTCPVAGECLAEAFDLDRVVRHAGVLRCATTGERPWRRLEAVVADLAPTTPEDWTALAAWVVDGEAAARSA